MVVDIIFLFYYHEVQTLLLLYLIFQIILLNFMLNMDLFLCRNCDNLGEFIIDLLLLGLKMGGEEGMGGEDWMGGLMLGWTGWPGFVGYLCFILSGVSSFIRNIQISKHIFWFE